MRDLPDTTAAVLDAALLMQAATIEIEQRHQVIAEAKRHREEEKLRRTELLRNRTLLQHIFGHPELRRKPIFERSQVVAIAQGEVIERLEAIARLAAAAIETKPEGAKVLVGRDDFDLLWDSWDQVVEAQAASGAARGRTGDAGNGATAGFTS